MIMPDKIANASPIIFTVLVLIVLMVYELGSSKIKKTLLPFVITLIVVFLIFAGIKVYSMAA